MEKWEKAIGRRVGKEGGMKWDGMKRGFENGRGGRGIHEIRVVKSGKEQREPGSGKRELDFGEKGEQGEELPKRCPFLDA